MPNTLLSLSSSVEAFARDMVLHFYETHITRRKSFAPKSVYEKHSRLQNRIVIEELKKLQKKAKTSDEKRTIEYLRQALLDILVETSIVGIENTSARRKKADTVARELGYKNHFSLLQMSRGFNEKTIARIATQYLAQTKQTYVSQFKKIFKKTILSEKEFERKLALAGRYQRGVSSKNVLLLGKAYTAKPSFTVTYRNNLAIPFLSPIDIPTNIIAVLPTICRSTLDSAGVFHEFGHAVGFANTSPSVPKPLRRLGAYDISEGYAFLFQHVFGEQSPSERELIAFYQCHSIRRACVRFLVQQKLMTGKPFQEFAVHTCKQELGIVVSSKNIEEYVDDQMTGVDFLKAEILRYHIQRWLEKKHGKKWWSSARAFQDLRSLMAVGNTKTSEELCRHIGGNIDDIRGISTLYT